MITTKIQWDTQIYTSSLSNNLVIRYWLTLNPVRLTDFYTISGYRVEDCLVMITTEIGG